MNLRASRGFWFFAFRKHVSIILFAKTGFDIPILGYADRCADGRMHFWTRTA